MQIIPDTNANPALFFADIDDQNTDLRNTGSQCSHSSSCGSHPGCTKMSVDQDPVYAAVDHKSHYRKPEGNPCNFHTTQCSKQDLRHRKEKVSKPDDRQIGTAGFNNRLVCCKKPQQLCRKKAGQDKQHKGNKKACAHGPGTDPSYRLCLFLSPVLTSEYDKSVSQRHKQLLKDELYLVYGGHTG